MNNENEQSKTAPVDTVQPVVRSCATCKHYLKPDDYFPCPNCRKYSLWEATPTPAVRRGSPSPHGFVGLFSQHGRKDRMKTEKESRIYYQDIVYHVCYALDLIDGKQPGHGIVCGTADEPNNDVFDRMKALVQEVHNLRKAQ